MDIDHEKLLCEDEKENVQDKDLIDEITLIGMKNGGHKRASPSETSVIKEGLYFNCEKCTSKFLSKSLFDVHMQNHEVKFTCNNCGDEFTDTDQLSAHIRKEHSQDEWNCMDCAFQANCASELLKHLKIKGHTPSSNIKDKRKLFNDYRQCYTCKMDFDGFKNLMDHRMLIHPSNRKCRKFPINCSLGNTCWYVHSENESSNEKWSDQFKCETCEKTIHGRNNFMIHKKTEHADTVPPCNLFSLNQCRRSEKTCWFGHKNQEKDQRTYSEVMKSSTQEHSRATSAEKQVFHKVTGDTPPPENVSVLELVKKLCTRMETMEKNIEFLMK